MSEVKSRFVAVPRGTILGWARANEFKDCTRHSGTQVIFERPYNEAKYSGTVMIRLFSSLPVNADEVRACGEDAMHVSLVYVRGLATYGILKLKAIHRTGTVDGIMSRVGNRVEAALNFMRSAMMVCATCASPAFADSGKCVVKDCKSHFDKAETCPHCKGAVWADSKRCKKQGCVGNLPAWKRGGPCQLCSGPTYTDSGKCAERPCRERGGCAAQGDSQ